jgi:hypothetical protein
LGFGDVVRSATMCDKRHVITSEGGVERIIITDENGGLTSVPVGLANDLSGRSAIDTSWDDVDVSEDDFSVSVDMAVI